MSIKTTSNLIDKGKYVLALKEIEKLSTEDKVEGGILKADALRLQEKINEAQLIIDNIIVDCRRSRNNILLVKSLIVKAQISMSDSIYDKDKIMKFIQESDTIMQEFDLTSILKRSYAEILSMKATLAWRKGDLESSHRNMTKSWLIRQDIGNITDQARSLTAFGSYCYSIGDLDSALNYYTESIKLFQLVEHEGSIAHTYCNIGRVFHRKGEFEKARNYYNQSLDKFNSLKTYSKISWVLFELIKLLLDLNQKENAERYFRQFTTIADNNPNDSWIQTCRTISKGLILNSSNRMRNKSKAQEIFTVIVQEQSEYHEFYFLAIKQLCSINMFELKANEDLEVLNETIELVNKLLTKGQAEYMHPIVIESMILHSKLKLIGGNLSEAANHLHEAKNVAKKKKLSIYLAQVEDLELEMKNQYETWEKMIETNRPIGERIAKSDLLNYFERAQGLVEKYKV